MYRIIIAIIIVALFCFSFEACTHSAESVKPDCDKEYQKT